MRGRGRPWPRPWPADARNQAKASRRPQDRRRAPRDALAPAGQRRGPARARAGRRAGRGGEPRPSPKLASGAAEWQRLDAARPRTPAEWRRLREEWRRFAAQRSRRPAGGRGARAGDRGRARGLAQRRRPGRRGALPQGRRAPTWSGTTPLQKERVQPCSSLRGGPDASGRGARRAAAGCGGSRTGSRTATPITIQMPKRFQAVAGRPSIT